MQRRNVKNNITQRLNSGSYNFTRSFRTNEKYLLGKIDEYQKYGTNMPGYIKQRLQQSQELLGRLRSSAATGAAAPPPLAAAATGVATGPATGVATGLAPLVAPANDFLGLAEPGGGGGGGGSVWVPRAAVANAPKKTVELELDTWIKWDTYPNDVPFKLEEPISGIGNGEYKLAAILGTKPLGQNVPYDLDLCIKDLCSRGEVKELDSANSFRPGVKGVNLYRPIKYQISDLQKIIEAFNEEFEGVLHKELTETVLNISPGEIGAQNLDNIQSICVALHHIKLSTVNSGRMYDIFDILTAAPRQVNANMLYKLLMAEGRPLDEINRILGENEFRRERIISLLEHPFINDPLKLRRSLDEFPSILFEGLTLIFVDEKKGFYIASNTAETVKYNRITQDKPRFKVIFKGKN